MSAAFWTEERLQFLRGRVTAGASAGQISAELSGAVSRSAVIAKAHRLGLRLGRNVGQPPKVEPEQIAAGPAPQPASKAKRLPRAKPNTTKARAEIALAPPEPPTVVQLPEREPTPDLPAGRVRLDELRTRSCRWPLGDPRDDDFGFCGAERPPGGPYCVAHARLAYQPATERRVHDRSVRSGVRA